MILFSNFSLTNIYTLFLSLPTLVKAYFWLIQMIFPFSVFHLSMIHTHPTLIHCLLVCKYLLSSLLEYVYTLADSPVFFFFSSFSLFSPSYKCFNIPCTLRIFHNFWSVLLLPCRWPLVYGNMYCWWLCYCYFSDVKIASFNQVLFLGNNASAVFKTMSKIKINTKDASNSIQNALHTLEILQLVWYCTLLYRVNSCYTSNYYSTSLFLCYLILSKLSYIFICII